jgi:hypothetical protein
MRMGRVLGTAAAIAILSAAGCTTAFKVPREKWVPGTVYKKSVVFHSGGTRYEFSRVSFRPDTLVGEYKVTVERRSAGEDVYYEDMDRRYAIPLTQVDSMAVMRRDPGKTFLYGAGFAALGMLIANMADRSMPTRSGPQDETKPTPENR